MLHPVERMAVAQVVMAILVIVATVVVAQSVSSGVKAVFAAHLPSLLQT